MNSKLNSKDIKKYFNDLRKNHPEVSGKHAILSPSGHHWTNYNFNEPQDFEKKYRSYFAQNLGTLVHAYAESHIKYRYKVTKNDKRSFVFELLQNDIPRNCYNPDLVFDNVMNYINDAIGFKMESEVPLYYSRYCFGTADAINYTPGVLKISDLKTGTTPASMDQLLIYAGLFFLQCGKDLEATPDNTTVELRIYQLGEVIEVVPLPEDIYEVMDKIKLASDFIQELRMGE